MTQTPRQQKSLTQLQVDFLTALGQLEQRVDDGVRRIDVEEDFLAKAIAEAKVPLLEIQKERLKIRLACKDGRDGKSADFWQKAVIERSRSDLLYWIDYWAYILNPHLTKYGFPMKLPLVLFPKQIEYQKWREDHYQKNKGGIVYKCRDVGVSWMNVTGQAWHWFFEDGFQGRFGSLKAEEVDSKNDPDSLFQKLRTIIYGTPAWMRPAEFHTYDNKCDTIMKMFNPVTKAVIAGQQGDNMGRGGRASIYDVDEWAKVQHDKMVDSNLGSNSPCVFYTGTPMGRDNDYAEKLTSGKIDVFSFEWYDDPRKTEDWLQNYTETHSKAVVQQEVLKSLDAFSGGTAIPSDWVGAAVHLHSKIESGEIVYEGEERVASLDVAAGGTNRTVMMLRKGIFVEKLYEWDLNNTNRIAEKAASVADEHQAISIQYDPIAVGIGVKSAFEDMDCSFRPIPVDVRRAPSSIPLEGDTRPASERCMNRRAELMERIRRRFEKTYEFMSQGVKHRLDDLIAIPDHAKLRTQLSVPERFSEHGKWRLESKEAMVKRGVESPDYFDATCLAFAEETVDMRVLRSFNPRMKHMIMEEAPVISLICNERNQNYVSVYHHKNLKAAAIGAVWSGVLTVYDEYNTYNPSIRDIVSNIQVKFHPRSVYEYVGNKEMFTREQDDLSMQYLDYGMMFVENSLYNEMASYAMLNQMIGAGQIRILKKCKMLIAQLDEFVRKKGGEPDKEGMELAMALCSLVNRLKEFGYIKDEKPVQAHYGRRSSNIQREPVDDRGWMLP